MTTETLKTASVLAFERKLDPSDALFHAGDWRNRDEWTPIQVREKSVRGTISNRMKTKDPDPAKLDAEVQKPNLQTIDVATLPHDADTLKVTFTLRVLGQVGQPSACNGADYRKKLQATVHSYVQQNSFNELAYRYACNLANARFLWRNRVGAEQIEVRVEQLVEGQAQQTWNFDALSISLRHFDSEGENAAALQDLARLINSGLLGEQPVLLRITAYARVGAGQEVFPSQELIMDRGRGDKSKTLYTVSGIAGLHSQKVGNALRSIDTWYEEADVNGPIAVEPYGSVTTQGKAYRQPRNKSKDDFYSLLDAWVLKDKVPPLEQQHFVIATLIRGGVFGEAG
ncbi:type I-F CRISPR-associated protein Csy3 [Pseudomonas parafulva]|uniref:type I-F CRISPR-associated protein Csy3 n=1 Tax=Pseudomonas parafulva TaxID=157782 RepID=UPI000540ED53|nr:type I-F CRISPR-associated protein Csy3 [Pseudomonas parafulva]AIZ31669.1 CRISPR-associated protein Cas5 [Pseudomonas parafulva]